MSHLPPELLSGSAGFSKTLFLSPPGHVGVLVICKGEKISSRHKKFTDAHAALDWCEKHQANFSYVMNHNPAAN
jgi:hypothetical protein